MIEPVLSGDRFIDDVNDASRQVGGFQLWWLGQSGFLVQWNGRRLVLDPYLSDSLTRKYAGTDKPHVRMTSKVVEPRALEGISVVTSSHHHTDHLDAETLLPMREANPQIRLVIPEAQRQFVAERLRCDAAWPIGLNDGESAEVDGFRLTGVPSAHETLERDEHRRCRFLGYVVRFGSWTLYHSGDTVLYPGMAKRLRGFAIDLALLPINGALPERRVAGNLNGVEASQLARDSGARLVIPCHYEMFEFNTATPDEFEAHARKIGQRFRVLKAGERFESREL